MSFIEENSAAIQAIATVVLVIVTVFYVVFTRSLAKEAKEQATAARVQSEAAREAVDRAFEDGVRQQAQLVQRQAILAARGELVGLLTKSIDWIARARWLALWAGAMDSLIPPPSTVENTQWPEDVWSESEELQARQGDCDFRYLDDYAGAFPLSAELTKGLQSCASEAADWLGDLRIELERRMGVRCSCQVDLSKTVEEVDEWAGRTMNMLLALRGAVRETGYARAFGDTPLDSAEPGVKRFPLVDREGVWAWDLQGEPEREPGGFPA